MPPYPNGRKPTRTRTTSTPGLIVSVPLCTWCKERVGFPCKVCGLVTCYMCLMSVSGPTCVHRVYKPVVSDGWGGDCPSPMCDSECNVCMGTGVV